MAAGPIVAFNSTLGCFASDDLVEVALAAAGELVLHEQRKITLVKLLEPLVPFNVFERLFAGVTGEVEADHADVTVAAGTAHTGGRRVSLFGPLANLLVIR